MADAIDELVSRSKDHEELRAFHTFHRNNPAVFDFLVREIQLRIEQGFEAFSYHSLWEYARWKLEMDMGPGGTFLMNDHATPYFGRALVIIHPEFNGRCEFRHSLADELFGTELEPVKGDTYARRLQWADGISLERGWRPSKPHVPNLAVRRRPDLH
ncbi:hypothetical protein SAMN05421771_1368 [Granulicella pectinivorans]|uniref:Uncharacterized protein n=1 Tax=Granulicella pectinivorans TaxID=474950 RepID=A0A1I6LVZ8_9BACT|nr:hypothetical protein [Granulicella pectinivorans]SFS07651.1 hypothetical protein SAMN05421771_1368 [Granulicella pectinivorans]